MRPAGLEPAAPGFEVRCSIQLSYGREGWEHIRVAACSKLDTRTPPRMVLTCQSPGWDAATGRPDNLPPMRRAPPLTSPILMPNHRSTHAHMNRSNRSNRSSRRIILASTGLLVLAGGLSLRHSGTDAGLSADDLDTSVANVLTHTDANQRTGALLIDFVEPEAGEGGSESEVAELARSLGATPAGFYSEGEHLFRVEGNPAQLEQLQQQLASNPLVEGSEPEMMYELIGGGEQLADDDIGGERSTRFEPNDEMFGLQWHMEQIHAPEAWTRVRGENTVVAVIDTGVAWKDGPQGARQVPDLAGTKFTHGKTFLANALPDGLDDHLHGTHVAGTIAQTTHNNIGVTGVAFESTIMPLKVLSGDGRGSIGAIANAIRYAADNGAQVINMSLGGPLPSRVLAKAVAYAHDNGVTVVCAAGNERKGRIGYPAAHKGAVAVAATDFVGERTWYSNWGKHLDISAPGGDTRADKNGDGHPDGVLQNTIALQDPKNNEYMWLQGTSMASPHAAGVAALVVSAGVTHPDEVERILKQTAVHPNNVEWDQDYGAGIIDANEALAPEDVAEFQKALRGRPVALIEQPLHRTAYDKIPNMPEVRPPFCADESLHTAKDLDRLWEAGYRAVNVKLDKCGGLTAGLELMRAAKAKGFTVMAGCMVGTSLAMAPMVLLESFADYIDLDGPLLLAKDRENGLRYEGSTMHPPSKELWG